MSQSDFLSWALLISVIATCVAVVWSTLKQSAQRSAVERVGDALAPGGVPLGAKLDLLSTSQTNNHEHLRTALTALDRDLRETLAAAVRDGLDAAFTRVQEGTKSQADALGALSAELRESVDGVRTRVEDLAGRVASAVEGIQVMLAGRLGEAEVAAAEGRADLLRDLTETFANGHKRTETALREFGEEQGRRLDAVAHATREGSAATGRDFLDFRTFVGERLEAVKTSTVETLEKSVAALSSIKTAMGEAQAATEKVLAEQRVGVLQGLADGLKAVNERLVQDLGTLTGQVRAGFDSFALAGREEQERLRTLVGGKLDEMRTGNESKLEQIRKTVDEQLQTALEKRVAETFQRVADQLTGMMQAIGQVQAVAGEVGDLKRLFSNVKVRGGWGEAQILNVLEDMLPAGAYATNVQVAGGTDVVEFALRMPVNEADRVLWLAIDAKFPTEDYDRLLLACEGGDKEAEAEARKALGVRIRNEAKRIQAKYVRPPLTVEYGVMFLPTEGLFAEVGRVPGLVEEVRRKHCVWIVGPALLPALLHCIRVGHLTLALEKKAGAIGETLGAVKAAWEDLVKALDLSLTRVNGLKTQLTKTQGRARTVGRALRTVSVLEFEAAETLLGLTDQSFANDLELDEAVADEERADAAD